MIDEAYGGDEGPCQCCGHDPADCICPVCPHCEEQGNPKCYEPVRVGEPRPSKGGRVIITPSIGGHGLKYNREQLMGQARMRIHELREKLQDEEMFLAYMESNPEDTGDES